MGLQHNEGEWISLQIKVFSRWVSGKLKNTSNVQVDDITKDLKDGVALVELAKILTNKEAPRRWKAEPKRNIDMVQNCELAIDMFIKDGVHFIGISGRDVHDSNEKLILGLVWTLISHYSIGDTKDSKASLLSWANDRTANYENVQKLSPYDLTMCAILDSYVPEKINFKSLDPNNSIYNLHLATDVMKELGIPVYIYPEDLNSTNIKLDQQVLLTQLSPAKDILENLSLNANNKADSQKNNNIVVVERSIIFSEDLLNEKDSTESEDEIAANTSNRNVNMNEDNSQYAGKEFALLMNTNGNDWNNAVTLERDGNWFLNPAGLKLNLAERNPNDVYQQFTFGLGEWNTVIDSVAQRGMVWDVANDDDINPPSGTPFYLFPFHGRHNQHFVYNDGKIIATQNGMAVTYVGGEQPFQMMPLSSSLEAKQTFKIQFL